MSKQEYNGEPVPPPQPAYYPIGGQQQTQYGFQQQQYGFQQPQGDPYGYNQPSAYGQQNPWQVQASYGQQDPRYNNSGDGETAHVKVPKATDDGDSSTCGDSFSDKAIRRGFIKKVYLILFTQLLFTFTSIALFIFVDPIRDWAHTDMGLWFYLASYGLFIILYIVLICVKSVRRKSPGNYICLGAFTLCFSYMAAMISSYHSTNIVLLAMGITALVCLSISLFAIQTKIDFTMCSGFLFVLCMVVFFFGWSTLITYYTWGGSRILNCVYGALVALLFGLFLIYDTQMIVGGRKYELSPEEYIYGALQLYVDVVYLFLIILAFFGKSN